MSVINVFLAYKAGFHRRPLNVSRPLLLLNLVRRVAKFDVSDSVALGGTPYDGLYDPIRGGSARKGYLFQASGIWKGRDFTR